jgi:hypothetical protein
MKIFIFFILCFGTITMAQTKFSDINNEIKNGNFSKASELLMSKINNENLSEAEVYDLKFQIEKMKRIKKDFKLTESKVLNYIQNYIPEANEDSLALWRNEGFLEYKVIDGEIKYFNRSHANFFRINKIAKQRKIDADGNDPGEPRTFLSKYIPQVVNEFKEKNSGRVLPVSMKLNYSLTVDANAVPEGEIIRCWLPYPRENHKRQTEIQLLSINADEYIIADNSNLQRTLYLEKKSRKDELTIFNCEISIKNYNEIYKLNETDIGVYDKESALYKNYTAENIPHIIFSDKVKKISEEIVGSESNPYLKVKKIFEWISNNIPWAGAREYSTIESISDYCLSNGYGDCGIKALTFITLCRYNGIPAKWQSGWMIYPTKLNLHDWSEVYFEGIGWVPVDADFGLIDSNDNDVRYFYLGGIDAYRLIVNDDYAKPLFPVKIFPRSETVDFQRGEVEWRGGNLYFDKWDYNLKIDFDYKSSK